MEFLFHVVAATKYRSVLLIKLKAVTVYYIKFSKGSTIEKYKNV